MFWGCINFYPLHHISLNFCMGLDFSSCKYINTWGWASSKRCDFTRWIWELSRHWRYKIATLARSCQGICIRSKTEIGNSIGQLQIQQIHRTIIYLTSSFFFARICIILNRSLLTENLYHLSTQMDRNNFHISWICAKDLKKVGFSYV